MTQTAIRITVIGVSVLLLTVSYFLSADPEDVAAGFCGNQPSDGHSLVVPADMNSQSRVLEKGSHIAHEFRGTMYFPGDGLAPWIGPVRTYMRHFGSSPPSGWTILSEPVFGNFVDFVAELVDSSGAVVRENKFNILRPGSISGFFDYLTVEDGDSLNYHEDSNFVVGFIDPPEYTSFVIRWEGKKLLNLSVESKSPNVPFVEISGVSEGQVFYADDTIRLSWVGADADRDFLTYRLYYSFDEGDSYRVLRSRSETVDREISIYTGWLLWEFYRSQDFSEGLNSVNFAISVSDGVNSTFSTTPVFEVLGISSDVSQQSTSTESKTEVSEKALDDLIEVPPYEHVYIDVWDNDIGFRRSDSFKSRTVFDSFEEADNFFISITDPPELGEVTKIRHLGDQQPNRYIEYVSFVSGCDSFDYRVCNTSFVCEEARVYINVGISDCTVIGTEGDDHLVGTSGNDIICGLGGDDTIDGLAGRDVIRGGTGNDKISGGEGGDYIRGEFGDDTIWGDSGEDLLFGGLGADEIFGGTGADIILGDDGYDVMSGIAGREVLFGEEFIEEKLAYRGMIEDRADELLKPVDNDIIDGGEGNDTIGGGLGNDTIRGGLGEDRIRGNSGQNTVHIEAETDVIRQVLIGRSSTDDQLRLGEWFTLVAGSSNQPDSLLDGTAFSWHSSIDGSLGTGRSIEISPVQLTVGSHEITVTKTNGSEKTDTHSIIFEKINIFVDAIDDHISARLNVPIEIYPADNDINYENEPGSSRSSFRIIPSYIWTISEPNLGKVQTDIRYVQREFRDVHYMIYVPSSIGKDSFQYRLCTEGLDCDTATVHITITE